MEEGIGQINMRKVASRCGLGLGTLYNYYPNKMDLIIAIVEGFWYDCFREFHGLYDSELDFFAQLQKFYFYMLGYLQQFRNNWMKDLSMLPADNRLQGKKKEIEYMDKLIKSFEKLLENHKDEFNTETYSIDKTKLSHFMMVQFMYMLRQQEEDYSFFDFTLSKILL